MSEPSTTRTDGPQAAPGQAPGGGPEDRRRKRLASYTVRNMVYSMLIVLLIVLAWWSMTSNPSESSRRPPELTQTTSYVVEQAAWPVYVPDPGEGWTPTVVWFEPVEGIQTWHVSYVSPQGEYVAVHQAADVTAEWFSTVLPSATRSEEAALLPSPQGERPWAVWEGPSGGNAQTAYELGPQETGGSTVVVHGTAGEAEFEAFLGTVTARD